MYGSCRIHHIQNKVSWGASWRISVKIGNDKKLCMPSGKRRSLSWRPLTECNQRFPEGIHIFLSFPIFTEYLRTFQKCMPTSNEVFLSQLDPCYLKDAQYRTYSITTLQYKHRKYSVSLFVCVSEMISFRVTTCTLIHTLSCSIRNTKAGSTL